MDYLKKSRIEEVLIAILGKGMVTSQLISRIEKILDAIRTDGSYDGPVMSEVEEILVCILNGEPFEKPTHSRIAAMLKVKANGGEYTELRKSRAEELIFEWINAVESATYTGTLPTTLRTVEGYLESYKIYGNTEQAGTPTPENPIEPQECGEKTENLFDGEMESGYYNNNGEKQSSDNWIRCKNLISTNSNTVYHAIINNPEGVSGSVVFARCYDSRGEFIGTASQTVIQYYKEYAFTTLDNTEFISFYVSEVYRNAKFAIYQTTVSNKPYEPYGYKLPLTANGVEYPIYLGEVQSTRRIKKLVLTGNESWTTYNMAYYIEVNDYYRMHDVGSHLSVCSHYPNAQMSTIPEMHYGLGGLIDGKTYTRWNGNIVFNPSPMISSRTDWISYLAAQYAAGTPVTIWYVLAEPEPAVVNEPLMKIGDYADTIDSTQTDVQIPTTAGSTTISWAGEGLAPSGVELTYSKPKSKWKE